jgi:eukaryotic-like serine/threonine-protein kinase
MGSAYYMSPEQVRGEVVDHRSDVYSVGVSLYEMVTGQRPFQSNSDVSIMAAHLQQTPKPPIELRPDLPEGLNDIIMTAMAKNPAERFQSADAFRTALKTVGAGLAVAKPGLQVPAAPTRPAEATVSSPYGFAAASLERPSVAPALLPPPAPPQTQPVPSELELSQRQGRHRGLYMGLGALVVVAVLVAAGLYSPRRNKVSAEGNTASAAQVKPASSPSGSTSPTTSASDSINNTQMNSGSPSQVAGTGTAALTGESAAGPGSLELPARDASVTDSNASRATRSPANTDLPHSRLKGAVVPAGERDTLSVSSDHGRAPAMHRDTDQSDSGLGTQAQSANSKELEDLERQIDQLASRAGSVRDSLDNLRRQQAAQGLGLRGDIATTQERMDIYLGKAQAAMRKEDATGTKKYMELAEPEIEKLEKFLGR